MLLSDILRLECDLILNIHRVKWFKPLPHNQQIVHLIVSNLLQSPSKPFKKLTFKELFSDRKGLR